MTRCFRIPSDWAVCFAIAKYRDGGMQLKLLLNMHVQLKLLVNMHVCTGYDISDFLSQLNGGNESGDVKSIVYRVYTGLAAGGGSVHKDPIKLLF